jgi:hypothetical protein
MDQISHAFGNVGLNASSTSINGYANGHGNGNGGDFRGNDKQNGSNGSNGTMNGRISRNGSASPSINGETDDTHREDRLIVGVDFGTTYSGYDIFISLHQTPYLMQSICRVAAVYSGTPDDIEVIKT